ncbi:AlpA family transcriptional regulator [Pseudacidovorax sp. RU35E]|uniref:helix-turn-helix transcriptional regulator n=1 Tax=Pseudacidovorax sp. RU35E TaxID=1907403 RepID=UPI0009549ED2|nr:AlpA family phage regulatory protein [Pseudacidovorax sp. RU35E]SIR80499.1 transcriptional regulator, AlpA family [Pseudacidovorax sp. RU35E]
MTMKTTPLLQTGFDPPLMRLPEVIAFTRRSRTSIYNAINQGLRHDPDFPQPIATGKRSKVWLRSEVEGWINERANNRKKRAP